MGNSAYEEMLGAAQANRIEEKKSLESLKEASRQRLLTIVEKKIRTTMIGALAAVEELIGKELWGHGKAEHECTSEQLKWRYLWLEKVRPTILNNGNSQLRAIQSEVVLYDMIWNGYRKIYQVKEQRKDNDNGRTTEVKAEGNLQDQRRG
jgi:hypothetical protein